MTTNTTNIKTKWWNSLTTLQRVHYMRVYSDLLDLQSVNPKLTEKEIGFIYDKVHGTETEKPYKEHKPRQRITRKEKRVHSIPRRPPKPDISRYEEQYDSQQQVNADNSDEGMLNGERQKQVDFNRLIAFIESGEMDTIFDRMPEIRGSVSNFKTFVSMIAKSSAFAQKAHYELNKKLKRSSSF